MDLTFAYSGKVQIELIEAKGQEENLYHRHLAEHGEGFIIWASTQTPSTKD